MFLIQEDTGQTLPIKMIDSADRPNGKVGLLGSLVFMVSRNGLPFEAFPAGSVVTQMAILDGWYVLSMANNVCTSSGLTRVSITGPGADETVLDFQVVPFPIFSAASMWAAMAEGTETFDWDGIVTQPTAGRRCSLNAKRKLMNKIGPPVNGILTIYNEAGGIAFRQQVTVDENGNYVALETLTEP